MQLQVTMMDAAYKSTLGLVWANGIEGTDQLLYKRLSKFLTAQEIQTRLEYLTHNGFITFSKDGMPRLTESGRRAITIVLCGGVFDILHYGHIHMLNSAKQLGDVLVVVVASDHTVAKKKKNIKHDAYTRRQIVSAATESVDVCVIGHKGDMFGIVQHIKPDVITIGYDQPYNIPDIETGCRKRAGLDNIRVVRLNSTCPDVSSSDIKKDISWGMI